MIESVTPPKVIIEQHPSGGVGHFVYSELVTRDCGCRILVGRSHGDHKDDGKAGVRFHACSPDHAGHMDSLAAMWRDSIPYWSTKLKGKPAGDQLEQLWRLFERRGLFRRTPPSTQ